MIQDNEAVYDEQIAPLMAQIIAVCKEHGIPFAAQFQYDDDHGDGAAMVTTTLPVDGQCPEIERVMALMNPYKASSALHLRIDHGDGTQTLETIIA